MAKVNVGQLIVDTLAAQGALSAQALIAATQLKGSDIKPAMEKLLGQQENGDPAIVVRQGTDFTINPVYLENGTSEAETEQDEFADAPTAVPAKAQPKAQAPAQRQVVAQQPKAQAPKAQAPKAQVVPQAEEGFAMSMKTMDKLTLAELKQRIGVAVASAEAHAATGDPNNLLVAETLLRTVARMRRRVNAAEKK